MRPLCDNYEITIRPLKDNYETTVRQLWNHYETTMRQLWDNYETTMRPLWDNYEITMRPRIDISTNYMASSPEMTRIMTTTTTLVCLCHSVCPFIQSFIISVIFTVGKVPRSRTSDSVGGW